MNRPAQFDTNVSGYKATHPAKPGQAFISRRQLRALKAVIFGIIAAMSWHFLHLAGEPAASVGSFHFWTHLVLEALLALYAGSLVYIILTLFTRSRR